MSEDGNGMRVVLQTSLEGIPPKAEVSLCDTLSLAFVDPVSVATANRCVMVLLGPRDNGPSFLYIIMLPGLRPLFAKTACRLKYSVIKEVRAFLAASPLVLVLLWSYR